MIGTYTRNSRKALCLTFALALCPLALHAGIQGYLKIDDIQGESQRADHEDEIDFYGLHWEINQGASSDTGTGRSEARAIVGPIKFYKSVDASSPYLALAALQGKSIPEAVAMVRKDSGDAHLDYLKITMTNCMVVSYEIRTDELSDQPYEVIGLLFEKINVIYIVQADDGSAGDEHEIEYDIVAGQ